MNNIPDELIHVLSTYCDPLTLVAFRLTCKRHHDLLDDVWFATYIQNYIEQYINHVIQAKILYGKSMNDCNVYDIQFNQLCISGKQTLCINQLHIKETGFVLTVQYAQRPKVQEVIFGTTRIFEFNQPMMELQLRYLLYIGYHDRWTGQYTQQKLKIHVMRRDNGKLIDVEHELKYNRRNYYLCTRICICCTLLTIIPIIGVALTNLKSDIGSIFVIILLCDAIIIAFSIISIMDADNNIQVLSGRTRLSGTFERMQYLSDD